jgi:serine/threonine-protein kinase HipA
MMKERKARVCFNRVFAGSLTKRGKEYIFLYDERYLADSSLPPISLTLPKEQAEYRAEILFPFFYGLLAEGENKAIQCQILKIDENDHFTRLIKTAGTDTIGAITVEEIP